MLHRVFRFATIGWLVGGVVGCWVRLEHLRPSDHELSPWLAYTQEGLIVGIVVGTLAIVFADVKGPKPSEAMTSEEKEQQDSARVKELEHMIWTRKQEAREKKLAEKAYAIAGFLGVPKQFQYGPGVPELPSFDDGVITIQGSCDTTGDFGILVVCYRGAIVFKEQSRNISTYIPGEWEKLLDQYYPQSMIVKQQQRAAAMATARAQAEGEKNKWGL
ncbi:MAG TPA: hypothetical protein VF123_09535 [Candidatus Sulfotelmatobacter sp.]